MTDEDLAARYQALRAAAAEVVHSALLLRYPAPYTPEMHTLRHLVLHEELPPSASEPAPGVIDPRHHSLAFRRYREDGTSEPYELEQLGAEMRAELDADRNKKEHVPDHPLRDVEMTDVRAMVIVSLLHELWMRLKPGPAMGGGEAGSKLAEIALECVNRMESMLDWTD